MDSKLVANLKDDILRRLSEQGNKHDYLNSLLLNLRHHELPDAVIRGYLEDMKNEGMLSIIPLSGTERASIGLQVEGERWLYDGGYSKVLEQELTKESLLENENQKFREKTDLEIENLKASTQSFKDTKCLSIFAIILSAVSILISVILQIFL